MSTIANNGTVYGTRDGYSLTTASFLMGTLAKTGTFASSRSWFTWWPESGRDNTLRVDINNSGDMYLARPGWYDWHGSSAGYIDVWHHYFVVINAGSFTVYHRTDGDEEWEEWATQSWSEAWEKVGIACSQWDEQIAAGSFARVRIWHGVALTTTQAMAESLSATPIITTGLRAYADGSDPGAAPSTWFEDSGANGEDLTAFGSPSQDAADWIVGGPPDQEVSPGLLSAALATPTMVLGGVTLSAAVLSASLFAPSVAASQTIAPAAFAASIASPSLVVGGVSVAPAALAATLATPSVVPGNRDVTPAQLLATLPTPAVAPGNATVVPSALAATIQSPTLATGNANVSPGALVAGVLGASVQSNYSLTPGAFAAALQSPTLAAAFTLTPGALLAALLTPTTDGAATLLPGALVAAVRDASLLSEVSVAAGPLGASLHSPSLQSMAFVLPAALVAQLLAPSLNGQLTIAPTAFAALLLAPTFGLGGVAVAPGHLVVPALQAPSLELSGVGVSPGLLQSALPQPTALPGGVAVTPDSFGAVFAAPSVSSNFTVAPGFLDADLFAPSMAVSGVIVSPTAFAAALRQPSAQNSLLVVQVGVTLAAGVPTPTLIVAFRGFPVRLGSIRVRGIVLGKGRARGIVLK